MATHAQGSLSNWSFCLNWDKPQSGTWQYLLRQVRFDERSKSTNISLALMANWQRSVSSKIFSTNQIYFPYVATHF